MRVFDPKGDPRIPLGKAFENFFRTEQVVQYNAAAPCGEYYPGDPVAARHAGLKPEVRYSCDKHTLRRYKNDPATFVEEVLGATSDERQKQIMRDYVAGQPIPIRKKLDNFAGVKVVEDESVPPDEVWVYDYEGNSRIIKMSATPTSLPTDSEARKNMPMATGFLDYFPSAVAAVAELSKVGNDKHNPGEPLHWARGKSMDHADTIMRHLTERGTLDTDGVLHDVKVAWRAMAMLQEELEKRGAPMSRGSRAAPAEPRAHEHLCSARGVDPR